jgi:hypothetical protein
MQQFFKYDWKMALHLIRRESDLLAFRAKRLPIKTAQINRARESTHDAVCCGQVSPVLHDPDMVGCPL